MYSGRTEKWQSLNQDRYTKNRRLDIVYNVEAKWNEVLEDAPEAPVEGPSRRSSFRFLGILDDERKDRNA